MDCVDCHNRPGHPFNSPDAIVNALLSLKVIDPGLPEIKKVAVKALDGDYTSCEEAHTQIEASVRDFYKTAIPTFPPKRARQSLRPSERFSAPMTETMIHP